MGSVSWHSELDHLDPLQEQCRINLYACVNGEPLGYLDPLMAILEIAGAYGVLGGMLMEKRRSIKSRRYTKRF